MQKGYSFDARGKFGYSGAFGRIAFGYNRFGFYHFLAGIYSKKYYYGKPYISKMKFYRPTNPRTTAQQNWRAICAYFVTIWQAFDISIKNNFKKRAPDKRMSGYNLFLSEALRRPPAGFGNILFSYNNFGLYLGS